MAVDRKIFIGDKVKTRWGVGVVDDATSWREAIMGLNGLETRALSDRCKVEAGINYKEEWVELIVRIGDKRHRELGHRVEVLESRDED